MDDVTACIDYNTDRLMQANIRTCQHLKSAAILTVEHRLSTIASGDLVVVIRNGVFGIAPKSRRYIPITQ